MGAGPAPRFCVALVVALALHAVAAAAAAAATPVASPHGPRPLGASIDFRWVSVHDAVGERPPLVRELARIEVRFDQPVFVHGSGEPAARRLGGDEAAAPPGLAEVRCPSGAVLRAGRWRSLEDGGGPGLAALPLPPSSPDARTVGSAFRRVGEERRQRGGAPNEASFVGVSRGDAAAWPAAARDEAARGLCSVHFNSGDGGKGDASPGVLGNFRGHYAPGASVALAALSDRQGAAAVRTDVSVWRLPPAPPPEQRAHGEEEGAAADCESDTSFVEEKMVFLEEGVQMVNTVAELVLGVAADPISEQMDTMLTVTAQDDMPKNTMHSILAGTPRLVTSHVSNSVARNVTNILVDALTNSLVAKLTPMLTNTLGPTLTKTVFQDVTPRVNRFLSENLAKSIPDQVGADVPQQMARTMPVVLTKKLTVALTHSLVPVLTQTLSFNEEQGYMCKQCYEFNLYCSVCHSSVESVYLKNYYGAYYAGYYSEFYAEYYTNAMVALQELQNAVPGTVPAEPAQAGA